jgi:hypothetical protein
MSWSIPTLIEQDIKNGKAQYRTFQTGNGGQSILPVPSNSYVVIFGYDFSPAGGGWHVIGNAVAGDNFSRAYTNVFMRPLETQQISFYTGTDFYPFIHHVNIDAAFAPAVTNASAPDNETVTQYQILNSVNNTPIARQVYITSTNDVTITHGLIQSAPIISQNAIPVTNRTPQGLTYGGSTQLNTTQTNYGPGATPQQFMQPSPKDYQDFAFGLLPANADGQAFATPDGANGLYPSATFLASLGNPPDAAGDYYLCLHYALYTETVPEQRG